MYEECMRDAGWSGVDSDEGMIFSFRDDQRSQFDSSDADCLLQGGLDTGVPREVSDEDRREGYESLLVMRDCLLANGFDIPSPPSIQSYLDEGGVWSPFMALEGEQQFHEAEAACPQLSFQ